MDTSSDDPVNHPHHYTQGKFEVIEVLEDWDLPFHLANSIKYIARHEYKDDPIQDLEKARWYLDRYINLLKEKHEVKPWPPHVEDIPCS